MAERFFVIKADSINQVHQKGDNVKFNEYFW